MAGLGRDIFSFTVRRASKSGSDSGPGLGVTQLEIKGHADATVSVNLRSYKRPRGHSRRGNMRKE